MSRLARHVKRMPGKRGKVRSVPIVALAATIVSLWSVPSAAQLTGSRLGRQATQKDDVTAIRMLAECYYDRNAESVRTWLQMLPGDQAEGKLLQRDAENLTPCLDSQKVVFDGKYVKFTSVALRRPVGAAMARRLLAGKAGLATPAADATPWFYPRLAALRADAKVDRISLAVQDFGHCVALADWRDSVALIKSDDGSREEIAAVQALLPVLGPCLDSGSQIKITRRGLRDMIGEPVYHLLLTPVSQGTRR